MEDQAHGRHEGDATVRRDRSARDGHEEEMDEAANIDELRGAVRAVWLQSALLEGFRVQIELLRSRRDKMGSLHRAQRLVRDAMLMISDVEA